jgi:hypothetical protein
VSLGSTTGPISWQHSSSSLPQMIFAHVPSLQRSSFSLRHLMVPSQQGPPVIPQPRVLQTISEVSLNMCSMHSNPEFLHVIPPQHPSSFPPQLFRPAAAHFLQITLFLTTMETHNMNQTAGMLYACVIQIADERVYALLNNTNP